MNNLNFNFIPLAALTSALCFAGCSANKTALKQSDNNGVASNQSSSSTAEPSLRNNLMREVAGLEAVYFAYDSSLLDASARSILKKDAALLREHPEYRVQIAGNCDERGTIEYNLALGQRRAAAVRQYYHMSGVALDRIATISYGKERPVCQESTEDCWAKNRRADTLVASPNAVTRNPN